MNPGFDFGCMLATAAQNIEQLELELRTTLLGKMAGQVHQLSKFLSTFKLENEENMSRVVQWLIRRCEPLGW